MDERCKRALLPGFGAVAQSLPTEVVESGRFAALHGEPLEIRRAPNVSGYDGAALCRDEGVRCPFNGGAGPCKGEVVLETGADPASIEDDKIHFYETNIVSTATASAGEEVEADDICLAAAAAGGGGGPNSAADHAAAAWARHALARGGADGDGRHLSAT